MDKIVQYKSFDGRVYSTEEDCLRADKQYLKNKKFDDEVNAITIRINHQWDPDLFKKNGVYYVIKILKDKNRYEDMIRALNEIGAL